MPAHGGRCLLVFVGIELFAECARGLGQQSRRDGGVDKHPCGSGQHGPLADSKKHKPKIGELIMVEDRLRSQAGNGIIAMSPGELLEKMRGMMAIRGRQPLKVKFVYRVIISLP